MPVLDWAPALVAQGLVPGGTKNNLTAVAGVCTWAAGLSEADRLILADAQTSGGLLIAVPADRADALVRDLAARATPGHAIVGELVAGEAGTIRIEA